MQAVLHPQVRKRPVFCSVTWVAHSATITHCSIELTLKICVHTDIASTEIQLKNHGQPENDRLTR
jgi:hypothetical protein